MGISKFFKNRRKKTRLVTLPSSEETQVKFIMISCINVLCIAGICVQCIAGIAGVHCIACIVHLYNVLSTVYRINIC